MIQTIKNQLNPSHIYTNSLAIDGKFSIEHFSWLLFNVIDTILTYIGITVLGATELHPLFSQFPILSIVVMKMCFVLLVMIFLNRKALASGSVIVMLVCVWNIANIAMYQANNHGWEILK